MSESSEQLIQRFRERLRQVERSRMIRPPELADFVDEHEVEELLSHIDHLTAELAKRQKQVETLRVACKKAVTFYTGDLCHANWIKEASGAIEACKSALAATSEPGEPYTPTAPAAPGEE